MEIALGVYVVTGIVTAYLTKHMVRHTETVMAIGALWPVLWVAVVWWCLVAFWQDRK